MQDNRRRRSFIIAGSIIIGLGLLYAGYTAYRVGTTAVISTDIVPSDAIVKLDSQVVRSNGTFRVGFGSHQISASRSGFASQSQTVTLKKGDKKTVSIYLTPTTAEGYAWIKAHPSEALKYEAVAGQQYDKQVQQAITLTPLVRLLPFIAPGFEFQVDYGSPQPNTTYPNQVVIYITAGSDQAKQDAIGWITGQGFDTSKLNIVYRN